MMSVLLDMANIMERAIKLDPDGHFASKRKFAKAYFEVDPNKSLAS